MKLIENRALSFVMLTLIYAAAISVGIVCYLYIPIPDDMFWAKLLVADVIATVFVFLFSLVYKNASVYDPYWSVQPLVIVASFAISAEMSVATALFIAAVTVWSVRLTANWAYTFRGLYSEDWRYKMFREKGLWAFPLINFFGFHMMPTLVVYACTLPAVYLLRAGSAVSYNAGTIVFFVLAIAAVALEGVADGYMHAFKKSGKTGFNRDGVWKYSRHPNYLGEILMWWAIALGFICVMPEMWYLAAGALGNTVMFLTVSIPLADKHQSRKDGFADYKKETRMLLPFPKRKGKEKEEKGKEIKEIEE